MVLLALAGLCRPEAWLLAGALAVLLGVVLLSDPSRGALGTRWAIGSFACLYGVLDPAAASALAAQMDKEFAPLHIELAATEAAGRSPASSATNAQCCTLLAMGAPRRG